MASVAETAWLMETAGGSVREFYAELGVDLPDRGGEEASIRCFANPAAHNRDDRTPSCSVNLLSGLFHCKACGESGNAYHAALRLGRSEGFARQLTRSHGLFLEAAPRPAAREKPRLPTEPQVKKWRRQLHNSPSVVARLGELKGWSFQAIVRCGVGWDGERVVFPVRAPVNTKHGRSMRLAGVVRYLPGGTPKSLALPGSKRLLFPAPEVLSRRRPLFVVEGEAAAVTVFSCGFQATGVPGVASWRNEWAERLRGRRVVVLPDCDAQGRELAARVARAVPDARVVDLDVLCGSGWDVGDMIVEARGEGGLGQVRRVFERLAAA